MTQEDCLWFDAVWKGKIYGIGYGISGKFRGKGY